MTKLQSYTDKNIVSRAEFARLNNWQRGRVTQLANDGRLVLAENGKDVCVIESLARIEATRDLSKLETVERHAKAREQKKSQKEIELQNDIYELIKELNESKREHSRALHAFCDFLGMIATDKTLLDAMNRGDADFLWWEFDDLLFSKPAQQTSANDDDIIFDDIIFADLHAD